MRLFFGLETDPATALAVAGWRDHNLPARGRPVPMANFHITLAFLGEVDARGLERLCLAVDEWQLEGIADCLLLDQLGYWPRPGICWLGPSSWPDSLDALAGRLSSLGRQGSGKRDRFRPHLTLFRRCHEPPPAPTTAPEIPFRYQRCTLFESQARRDGVSYHPVADWGQGNG